MVLYRRMIPVLTVVPPTPFQSSTQPTINCNVLPFLQWLQQNQTMSKWMDVPSRWTVRNISINLYSANLLNLETLLLPDCCKEFLYRLVRMVLQSASKVANLQQFSICQGLYKIIKVSITTIQLLLFMESVLKHLSDRILARTMLGLGISLALPFC